MALVFLPDGISSGRMKYMIEKLLWRMIKFVARTLWTITKVVMLIIGREVLMRKRAEVRTNELVQRETQRRMNEFINIASHELKTPLTSIKGNIQLMARRLRRSLDTSTTDGSSDLQDKEVRHLLAEAKDLLERTDKQITQLSRLVHTLLEGSRINANAMDLLLELCELDTLVREVTQDTRHIPDTRTVHVEVLSDKTILVMADVNRVKQVVIHYLSNAHKYSPIAETIEISLKTEGQMARVSVRDKGPGIPPGEHHKIWERFYRIPNIEVVNGSEVGLGLGLHISRAIIEQHHGHVGLQSAPGAGSTFWFTLPVTGKEMNN